MIIRACSRAGLLALTWAAIAVRPAEAQTRIDVSTFLGGTWFLTDAPSRFAIPVDGRMSIVSDARFDNGITLGANTGLRISDHWGIEAQFAWLPTKLRASQGLESYAGEVVDVSALMYGGSVLYHFVESGTVRPFLALGVGAETMIYEPEGWGGRTELMGNVAMGAILSLDDSFGFRLDVRECITRFRSGVAGVANIVSEKLMFSAGATVRLDL